MGKGGLGVRRRTEGGGGGGGREYWVKGEGCVTFVKERVVCHPNLSLSFFSDEEGAVMWDGELNVRGKNWKWGGGGGWEWGQGGWVYYIIKECVVCHLILLFFPLRLKRCSDMGWGGEG